MKHWSMRADAAISVGIALFFVMGRFVSIPMPIPQTSFSLEFAVLAVFAALYGPRVGFWVGLIGNLLLYATLYGFWWSWILTAGLLGLAMGFCYRLLGIHRGAFGVRQIVLFIVLQWVLSAAAWMGLAPVLDVLLYGEPWLKVVAQGAMSFVSDCVTIDIAGVSVLLAYAQTVPKKDSLKMERRPS